MLLLCGSRGGGGRGRGGGGGGGLVGSRRRSRLTLDRVVLSVVVAALVHGVD